MKSAQTVIIWLFLIFVAGSSLYLYIHEQGNSRRLLANLEAANQTAKQFKTKDGHNATKLIAQDLTIKELRRVHPEIIAQLKNLYISPRLVQSYTAAAQTFSADIKTPVTTKPDTTTTGTGTIETKGTIETFTFLDKWISVTGQIKHDTAALNIQATDTIFTAIYKGDRRHPWAWILSRRQLTAAATNRSPYIKINVIQAGVIKK